MPASEELVASAIFPRYRLRCVNDHAKEARCFFRKEQDALPIKVGLPSTSPFFDVSSREFLARAASRLSLRNAKRAFHVLRPPLGQETMFRPRLTGGKSRKSESSQQTSKSQCVLAHSPFLGPAQGPTGRVRACKDRGPGQSPPASRAPTAPTAPLLMHPKGGGARCVHCR